MRHLLIILITVLSFSACRSSSDKSANDRPDSETSVEISPENVSTINFDVGGMTCTGCENTVKQSLENLPGVVETTASYQTGQTVVKYDKTLVTIEGMETNIESKGYKVKGYSFVE